MAAIPSPVVLSESLDHTDIKDWFHLEISHVSLVLLVLGAYIVILGQISYFVKERLFLSSALIALVIGIDEITFQFTRVVIGIQVCFCGVDLPAAYLWREKRTLFVLLVPIMTIAWFVSAGFILAFIPGLSLIEALCISACVTPTDPILANAIVKGRYAEKHVPVSVRNIIASESGANDGLGLPFIFLPILLMRRSPEEGESVSKALQHWVIETWMYQVILACAMGALIGWVARITLKQAHNRRLIDHESFLAYGVGLALFTLGIVGLLGSDDLLACFIVGNSLTWKDFYRVENQDDTFQDVIDHLLNTSIFIYIGTIIPWSELGNDALGLKPWKLVLLAICILLFRRLPWVMAMYRFTSITDVRQAVFTGWFGPIGVSAVYYAILAERWLPYEREHLRAVIKPVVLFMALSSTITHGVSIPLQKFAPLALSHTRSFSSIAGAKSSEFFANIKKSDVRVMRMSGQSTPAQAMSRPQSRAPTPPPGVSSLESIETMPRPVLPVLSDPEKADGAPRVQFEDNV